MQLTPRCRWLLLPVMAVLSVVPKMLMQPSCGLTHSRPLSLLVTCCRVLRSLEDKFMLGSHPGDLYFALMILQEKNCQKRFRLICRFMAVLPDTSRLALILY